jgi:hypothetical protein
MKLSDDSSSHIPLRDSKLTRILGPSLMGQAKVIFLATLNPTSDHLDESINTLSLIKKAQGILQTLSKNPGTGEVSYLYKFKSDMAVLKEKLEGISGINSLKSSISEQDEEEKASLEIQLESLQTAILVSEMIRDSKLQSQPDEDLLDFSDRRSLRLRYWRESNSTLRNSSLEEVEEEDSLPNPYPRMSDFRLSIPEEPSVGSLSPFECKQHLEMFRPSDRCSLDIGSQLLKKEGVPLPHPEWLQLILDQESLITELQAQLALKTQENKSLKEEVKFCKEKLMALKAKLIS